MVARGVVALLVGTAVTTVNGLSNFADPKKRPSRKEWEAEQKKTEDEAAAKAAKEAKMAAVNKAVVLLKDLQKQILKEGEEEAATYNKFACFCKDTTSEKSEAITKGSDEKEKLIAGIESKSAERERLDGLIDKLVKDIKQVEKDMKKLTKDRSENLASYEKTVADMEPALTGLRGAIKAVKNSKAKDSFMQLGASAQGVRSAVLLADAMGFSSAQEAAKVFLQAPDNEVPMENYKFHSEGIIGTLEKLLQEFQDELNSVNKAEVQSVHEYDMAMQDKQNVKKTHERSMDKTKKAKEETSAEIASLNEQLSTVSATLLDDKDYLMTLSKMCRDKALTWDQRSKARADELATLTQATEVITTEVAGATSAKTARLLQSGASLSVVRSMAQNEEFMNYVEDAAEAADAGAPSFLQISSPVDDGKRQAMIAKLLQADGTRLKSILLASLASKISVDPLAKVKGLIQELIEKLLQEAAQEANEKGFCDKATSDAEQKRDYAAEAVASLNSEMATLEATTATLTEELEVLSEQISDLKDARQKAVDERKEEQKENEATIKQADAGLSALNMVIDILDKFYKTMKKNKVDLSLAQRGPMDDAPEAGFDNGEAYTGAQAAAGGILGMLDVMKSDFERTISQTEKEEEESQKDHMEFMTQSGISLAEKEEAVKLKSKQNDSAKTRLEEAGETFEDKAKTLRDAVAELLELKPRCVDTGMSYEDRVARREDEIESLKKALCIFDRYEEYGPGGAADGC